jgi:hypothetical protein
MNFMLNVRFWAMLYFLAVQSHGAMTVFASELTDLGADCVRHIHRYPFPHLLAIPHKEFFDFTSVDFLCHPVSYQ